MRKALAPAACAAALLWVNLYICRDLFTARAGHMNAMHGTWIGLARLAQGSWWSGGWFPFWDAGIPFEAAYSPLVPAATAAYSALLRLPVDQAFFAVSGFVYLLGPLALFFALWRLSGSPAYSFAAALAYSLLSPTQLLLPDGGFGIGKIGEARRLFLISVWDDTPHAAALALLPLLILFLWRALETRRIAYTAAAAATAAAMALASVFGVVQAAMAALCLLFVMGRVDWRRNLALAAAIAAWAYALASPYLSPSLIRAIRTMAADSDVDGWNPGSVTALAVTVAGWMVLWHYLARWTKDRRLHFFALFAWLTGSIPLMGALGNRHFLPQPGRYKLEFELALALLSVFALRSVVDRFPAVARRALVLVLLALAFEQTVAYRRFEKSFTFPIDVTRTVEYRAAVWTGEHLAGTRVYLPGSVGQWANAFSDVSQYGGGSFTMAANLMQQYGHAAIVFGGGTAEEDARNSLLWLKAFGTGAVGVSSPGSREYWKGFTHPAKFDGLLPALWSEDGVTIYRVPLREPGFAHVVPQAALVSRPPATPEDVADLQRYVAALDDPSLPTAASSWQGRNLFTVRTPLSHGQALTVQVNYHPGWQATANGRSTRVHKDGLGLMWIAPACDGACLVELRYDGGWESRLCRWLSCAALAGLLAAAYAGFSRRTSA